MSDEKKIETVTINGVTLKLADLPDTEKKMVSLFVRWSQEEGELQDALLKVQAAKRDLNRELVERVAEMQKAASAIVKEEAVVAGEPPAA